MTKAAFSMAARPSPTMRRAPSKTVADAARCCAALATNDVTNKRTSESFVTFMWPPFFRCELCGEFTPIYNAVRMLRTARNRLLIYAAIVVVATAVGWFAAGTSIGEQLELRTYDYRFRLKDIFPDSSSAPITLLAIDERSL